MKVSYPIINLLYTALNLSQSVYCNSEYWNCTTCSESNTIEYVYENYGEKVLIGYNNKLSTLFASFRGSSNIENWIDNIQIEHTCIDKKQNICFETGFYKLYNQLYSLVHNKLETAKEKYHSSDLLLTGHSMGAAIGTLFAYNLSSDYNTSLITFGSPRVGNFDFVQAFTQNPLYTSSRITHYYDIVPHLPQYNLNYHHIPNEIWYNEDNTNYTICDDTMLNEDDRCSNSCYPFHCTSISDHLHYLNVTFGSEGDC